MSEPYQLYARVRLSRERRDAFFASAFPDPSDDADVLAWLSGATYYGDPYTPEKIRDQVVDGTTTIDEWVDVVTGPGAWGRSMPFRNAYDATTQTWTLAVLDFSENYDDFIAAVAVFREIATYKDLPGDDGMLVFGHLFEENAVTIALRIAHGSAEFISEDAAGALVAEADEAMRALTDEGAAASASD